MSEKTPNYGLCLDPDQIDTLYPRGEDFTKNGKCSRCGNCCTHHLGLLTREKQQIHNYVKQHNLQPIHHRDPDAPKDAASIDLMCPFFDNTVTPYRCTIYPVRPFICKSYQCNLTSDETIRRMDQYVTEEEMMEFILNREETNLQQEFFSDIYTPKAQDYVIVNQVHMKEHQRYMGHFFYVTGRIRFGRHHLEIQLKEVKTKETIWFDIKGLTKLEW